MVLPLPQPPAMLLGAAQGRFDFTDVDQNCISAPHPRGTLRRCHSNSNERRGPQVWHRRGGAEPWSPSPAPEGQREGLSTGEEWSLMERNQKAWGASAQLG